MKLLRPILAAVIVAPVSGLALIVLARLLVWAAGAEWTSACADTTAIGAIIVGVVVGPGVAIALFDAGDM